MQAKGLIKFFVAALIAVCTYQLMFTVVGAMQENKADNFAQERVENIEADNERNAAFKYERRKYIDSVYNETVFSIGVADFTYAEVIQKKINLGLDLQGGMSVVLEVSLKELIIAMAGDSKDTAFRKAIEDADARRTESDATLVTLFAEEVAKNPAIQLVDIFNIPSNKGIIEYGFTNEQVIDAIRTEADDAVDRTYKIINTRIDQFGVANPSITRQPGSSRIIVELPGIDNPERARGLLQATAKLEFWETASFPDLYGSFVEAENVIKNLYGLADTVAEEGFLEDGKEATDVETETFEETEAATQTDSTDDGLFTDNDGDDDELFDADDTTSAQQQENNSVLFGNLLIPNFFRDDAGTTQIGTDATVGYSLGADRDSVMALLNLEDVKELFSSDVKFLWGKEPNEGGYYPLFAIKMDRYQDKAPLEGDAVISARQDMDPISGQVVVNVTMNSIGKKVWAKMTGDNVGRQVAIVLDDIVYSAPNVQEAITGGNTRITGDFTIEEGQDLANTIKAGKLPAPADIVEEEIVGPTLGAESVNSGAMSLVLGMVLVLLFMIFYYAGGGIIADIVLLLNMFFIMGVLASFGASLTLPGMAGIVLTIGMAVDANVIIFERIREELARGKGLRLAIADGYSNSYSAIIDANLTTLITGFILLFFGLGPVKGFATVLVIGIISSFLTAVLVSRLIVDAYVTADRELSFSTKMSEGLFKNMNIDFLSKRTMTYGLSGILLLASVGSIAMRGFELGVDFEGGRSFVVRFDDNMSSTQVGDALVTQFGTRPQVKTYGSDNQLKITTSYKIDDKSQEVDAEVEELLYEGLKPYLGGKTFEQFLSDSKQSSMKVDATIADDIRQGAFLAGLLSFVGIFLYILVRFRKWQFGLGALAAIVHDAILLLGIFSIFHGILPFSMEIDQAFIAALLTVIGYSINDTVVVFDRIREFIGLHPTKDLKSVTNMAVNTTLSRTIMTSLTTFIVILCLTIFGGPSILGFAFALLLGVVIGTYSSIFIATPIAIDMLSKDAAAK